MAAKEEYKRSEQTALMRFRQKTKQLLLGSSAGAAVSIILLGGLMVHNYNADQHERQSIEQKYQLQIKQMKQEAEAAVIKGWVPKQNLTSGQVISESDLALVEIPKAAAPVDLISSVKEITGKYTKVNLAKGNVITESLLFSEGPASRDLRYREMSFVQLPSSLQQGDVIDIRIQFPSGEDYVLLSKKKVLQMSGQTVSVTLGEQEILTLSSAIVDAYLHKASIYSLMYVEPGIQAKAIPTYPANEQVTKLLARDPNIEAEAETYLSNQASRKMLEQGLTAMSPQNALDFASSQAAAATAASAGNAPLSQEELEAQNNTQEKELAGYGSKGN